MKNITKTVGSVISIGLSLTGLGIQIGKAVKFTKLDKKRILLEEEINLLESKMERMKKDGCTLLEIEEVRQKTFNLEMEQAAVINAMDALF